MTIFSPEVFLLLGALVVVPLGMGLMQGQCGSGASSGFWTWARRLHLPCAALLIAALYVPQGTVAGLLTLPYLAVTGLAAAAGVTRFLRRGPLPLTELCVDAGLAYLGGAGVWTLLSRLGARPLGFDDQIVHLTAMHLHYVGFALPLLTSLTARALGGRAAAFACCGVMAGFPTVAAGIVLTQTTGHGAVELAAVVLLAAICWLQAVLQFRVAWAAGRPGVLMALAVSSVSLATAMALAVVYALGQFLGTAWLDIPLMLPTHGVLNGLGFTLFGLWAWRANRLAPAMHAH
jgi:hypothetical protein